MENIIKIVEGDNFSLGKCYFCDEKAKHIFGIVEIESRYNGNAFQGYHVCEAHLDAINSLLDGTKDINLLLRQYENIRTGRTINLRA